LRHGRERDPRVLVSDSSKAREFFADRAARADVPKAFVILKRAGVGNPPMKGDKLRRAKRA
jgi:hypothetical protein